MAPTQWWKDDHLAPGMSLVGNKKGTVLVTEQDLLKDTTGQLEFRGPHDSLLWLGNHLARGWKEQHTSAQDFLCALYALEISLRPIYRLHGKEPPTFERLQAIHVSSKYSQRAANQFCSIIDMSPKDPEEFVQGYQQKMGTMLQDIVEEHPSWGIHEIDDQLIEYGYDMYTFESLFSPSELSSAAMAIILGILRDEDNLRIALGILTEQPKSRGSTPYTVSVDDGPARLNERDESHDYDGIAWVVNDNAETSYGDGVQSHWSGMEPDFPALSKMQLPPKTDRDTVGVDGFKPALNAISGNIDATTKAFLYREADSAHLESLSPRRRSRKRSNSLVGEAEDEKKPVEKKARPTVHFAKHDSVHTIPNLAPSQEQHASGNAVHQEETRIILFHDVQGEEEPTDQDDLPNVGMSSYLLPIPFEIPPQVEERAIIHSEEAIDNAPHPSHDLDWKDLRDISIEELLIYFPNHALSWPYLALSLRLKNWDCLFHRIAYLIFWTRGFDFTDNMQLLHFLAYVCRKKMERAIQELQPDYTIANHDSYEGGIKHWRNSKDFKALRKVSATRPQYLQNEDLITTVKAAERYIRRPMFKSRPFSRRKFNFDPEDKRPLPSPRSSMYHRWYRRGSVPDIEIPIDQNPPHLQPLGQQDGGQYQGGQFQAENFFQNARQSQTPQPNGNNRAPFTRCQQEPCQDSGCIWAHQNPVATTHLAIINLDEWCQERPCKDMWCMRSHCSPAWAYLPPQQPQQPLAQFQSPPVPQANATAFTRCKQDPLCQDIKCVDAHQNPAATTFYANINLSKVCWEQPCRDIWCMLSHCSPAWAHLQPQQPLNATAFTRCKQDPLCQDMKCVDAHQNPATTIFLANINLSEGCQEQPCKNIWCMLSHYSMAWSRQQSITQNQPPPVQFPQVPQANVKFATPKPLKRCQEDRLCKNPRCSCDHQTPAVSGYPVEIVAEKCKAQPCINESCRLSHRSPALTRKRQPKEPLPPFQFPQIQQTPQANVGISIKGAATAKQIRRCKKDFLCKNPRCNFDHQTPAVSGYPVEIVPEKCKARQCIDESCRLSHKSPASLMTIQVPQQQNQQPRNQGIFPQNPPSQPQPQQPQNQQPQQANTKQWGRCRAGHSCPRMDCRFLHQTPAVTDRDVEIVPGLVCPAMPCRNINCRGAHASPAMWRQAQPGLINPTLERVAGRGKHKRGKGRNGVGGPNGVLGFNGGNGQDNRPPGMQGGRGRGQAQGSGWVDGEVL